jgi:glycosidase
MRTFLLPLAMMLVIQACTPKKESAEAVKFPERAKDMNIYEVNIRQYTPEGTINAFAAHLPRLQKMGVDILWIMPVQPIGVEKRKGGLGSYYSISDYVAVNPEFGTMEDFKALVNKAHELGMLVILDWVANHTSFDHAWTKNDGWHTRDDQGNIVPPVDDWSDVADLNFDNIDMQNAMIDAMRFWVKNADIDGFRCDVAGFVPVEFWNRAKDSLDVDKDVFMLAEWEDPAYHSAFHMSYGWEFHHLLNKAAKGEKDATDFAKYIAEDIEKFGQKAFKMNFITNHDENSWNGTEFERMGDGHQAYAVISFTAYGMPLIYSGQEAGLNKRLRFFEKDTIEWNTITYGKFYSDLIRLKKENPALYNGEYGGIPQFANAGNDNVLAYKRAKDGNEVAVVVNLTGEPQSVSLTNASFKFKDYFTGKELDFTSAEIPAFGYYIGVRKAQ